MIGISGLARSGKDTLANNFAEIISEDWGLNVKIFSFADEIKRQADNFLKNNYKISAFSENTKEKEIIRDFLVCHGETMKKIYGNTIWADIIIKEIKGANEKFFPIITDVRFDFEAKRVKEVNGQVVHIEKIGNKPPNNIEAKNDPLVKKESDLNHCWGVYEPDQMKLCKDHANLLWQMLKETHEELWKKIYI
jgi:hypothetical protein